MAKVSQWLRVFHKKNSKPKGVFINRKSVGLIYINGHPYIYNADLVYHNQDVSVEQMLEDYERKEHKPGRRIIVVRRK